MTKPSLSATTFHLVRKWIDGMIFLAVSNTCPILSDTRRPTAIEEEKEEMGRARAREGKADEAEKEKEKEKEKDTERDGVKQTRNIKADSKKGIW